MPDPVKRSGGVTISQVPLKRWDGQPNAPSKRTSGGEMRDEGEGYAGRRDQIGESND